MRDDRILGSFVDRRRLVTAETLADDGLALVARRQLLEYAAHVLDRRAAEREPIRVRSGTGKAGTSAIGRLCRVEAQSGMSSKPLVSFG